MSRLIAILLLSLTLFVGTASAQDSAGVAQFERSDVQTVTFLLSGYHELAPRASFEEVAHASAIVDALARGPHSMLRDRALAALGKYWPSADVYLLYANVVASDATADGTRHRVVKMFVAAFGDRAIPAIRPLLGADDLQLQITTVQALGTINTDEAYGIIVEFAKTATDPVLLAQIDRSARLVR